MNNMYYLNNTGPRWVTFDGRSKEKLTFQTKAGKTITRTVQEWQSWGNFAIAIISYKGKKIKVFADTILDD